MFDPVLYLGPVCSVVHTRTGYEVRVHAGTHSVCVGTRDTADAAIRTAHRLERYPDQCRTFAGV